MNKVDWSVAPKNATHYARGKFRKFGNAVWSCGYGKWVPSELFDEKAFDEPDFELRPDDFPHEKNKPQANIEQLVHQIRKACIASVVVKLPEPELNGMLHPSDVKAAIEQAGVGYK